MANEEVQAQHSQAPALGEVIPAAPEMGRLDRLRNIVKANLAPIAVAAAGVWSAFAYSAPTEAFAAGPTTTYYDFVDYNQGDWGNRYAETGCGPTADAMVVATETGNSKITPHTIGHLLTPRYWAYGSGTDPAGFRMVAKHYGLAEQHSNLQGAKEVLREGGLAIVHARPGHFTSAGHYMVLKSLYHGRFRIADPNDAPGRDSEVRWWSPTELKHDGVDDVWTFEPPQAKNTYADSDHEHSLPG